MKMFYSFPLISLSISLLFSACVSTSSVYDFSFPNEHVSLEKELNEISGLSLISDYSVACIQDEKAKVFFLNCHDGSIESSFDFGHNGDFEGLATNGDTAYILRSDGDIFITTFEKKAKHHKFKKESGFEFEGVCMDLKHDRLLVACKQHRKKSKNKSIYIYGFSLRDSSYFKDPIFVIQKKKVHPNFMASGISIHPNGDIYIISSVSKTLLVLNNRGKVKMKTQLDGDIYKQPEGISINSKGEIFISNEKNKGKATLLKIDPL